jgi:hypothetical protein
VGSVLRFSLRSAGVSVNLDLNGNAIRVRDDIV